MIDNNGIPSAPTGIPTDVLWVIEKIGWPVFPVYEIERGRCACSKGAGCSAAGKHPRTMNGVKDATADLERVTAWAERWPMTNWAASPVGGLVVDVDPRNGGFDSIGQWGDLPATTTVLTGGAGKHLYFTLPEGIEVSNRNPWLDGVDIKTKGGYVVLPGSNHISGATYQWGDQRDPVVAPEALIASILEGGHRQPGSGLPSTSDLLDGVGLGQRDDMIFRACCRWWRQYTHHEDGGIEKVTALALEMGAKCNPPFSKDEVIAKVQSAARYALDDPKFRHTDDGNALLFVEQHARSIKFTSDSRAWFAWDGQRWMPDADLLALSKARDTARSLVDYALELETDDQKRAAALGHAKASLSAGRINAVPSLAKSDARLHVRTNAFDTRHDLLNTLTGTVNLRTGELRPHDSQEFHSKLTAVGYDPQAVSEWWDQWVWWAMCGRADLVDFLQRSVGYAITGETSEQAVWLHNGEGANGKSTLMKILGGVLAEYAHSADPELLTGGHTTGLADLHGKRFVALSEIKDGSRVDEQRLKMLSGEDDITARFLYKDFFTFRSTATIFWAMNHLPKIADDTYGMWRRIFVVPWDATVPRDQMVKGLADWVIKAHGAAVLRWAVDGAVKWYDSGLTVPDDVLLKTKEFKDREDGLGRFIEDMLIKDEEAWLPVSSLTSAYDMWCNAEGIMGKEKLGSTTLKERVESRLGIKRKRKTVEGTKGYGYEGYRVAIDAIKAWG